MFAKPRSILVAILIAFAGAGILGAACSGASQHVAARAAAAPSLRVLGGQGSVSGVDRGSTRLDVSASIADVGRVRAARPLAWVQFSATNRAFVATSAALAPLAPGARRTLHFRNALAVALHGIDWTIEVCVAERSGSSGTSGTHCTAVGPVDDASSGASGSSVGTRVTAPISGIVPDRPIFEPDGLGQYENTPNLSGADVNSYGGYYTSGYWVDVPRSYRPTRPETLLVWLHACNGTAHFDDQILSSQYSTDRSYIVIAPSGPENADTNSGPPCWNTSGSGDVAKVLTDISQAETHFDINPRRVIIGGYSSGGNLAYQTIFTHADAFAGILAINTDPVLQNAFANSIRPAAAAAAWRFPIRQIVHTADEDYPFRQVIGHLNALKADGFAVSEQTLTGTHYDPPTPTGCQDSSPSTCTGGTNEAIGRLLVAGIATDGWESPAP